MSDYRTPSNSSSWVSRTTAPVEGSAPASRPGQRASDSTTSASAELQTRRELEAALVQAVKDGLLEFIMVLRCCCGAVIKAAADIKDIALVETCPVCGLAENVKAGDIGVWFTTKHYAGGVGATDPAVATTPGSAPAVAAHDLPSFSAVGGSPALREHDSTCAAMYCCEPTCRSMVRVNRAFMCAHPRPSCDCGLDAALAVPQQAPALRELVEKWRVRALALRLQGRSRRAVEADQCADELDAALALPVVRQGQERAGDTRVEGQAS